MTGIRYITDENGKQIAVQLDLSTHGQLWDDVYDNWLAEQRADEPRDSLDAVKTRLARNNTH